QLDLGGLALARQGEAGLLLGDAHGSHLLGGLLALDALALGALQLVVVLAHFPFFVAAGFSTMVLAKSRLITSLSASAKVSRTFSKPGSAFLKATTTAGS